MVAQYIPALLVIGAALVSYRLLGLNDLFTDLIKAKELKASYDYLIGANFIY